jgi:hypothetical protein
MKQIASIGFLAMYMATFTRNLQSLRTDIYTRGVERGSNGKGQLGK